MANDVSYGVRNKRTKITVGFYTEKQATDLAAEWNAHWTKLRGEAPYVVVPFLEMLDGRQYYSYGPPDETVDHS